MNDKIDFLATIEKAEHQRMARRNFIRMCGGAAAMTGGLSLLSACGDDDTPDPVVTPTPAPTQAPVTDADILNFALQLEYLEGNYYSYAVTGAGIPANLRTGTGFQSGVITGSGDGAARAVNFSDPVIAQYAREIAYDELAHITFLRTQLGSAAVAQPSINLSGSAAVVTPGGATVPGAFTAAARAAGVIGANEIFDPFANDINFLIGSYLLTDVGVTAYRGSARLITNKTYLDASAGILATEAYHDGVIRSSLYALGLSAPATSIFDRIQRISDSRDALDGSTDTDQGIGTASEANLVPTDANGLVLGRTANQVLNVVFLNAAVGTQRGGFFPEGVNGNIRTTVANP
ncbi:ferritin-like domain-containing protein [Sphingomonas sp. BT552]|uniref:Ferritin-like domain-containing protein n=1 Tax=Sphingomonas longa TaxID=2778730 RepID=A0ABS2DBP2_9SPHN|nr:MULTISPECIES: ferritin-like domain-containing protein [Alphaproteobacteria]MBM6578355.1 ferritin-like domain-containing protein [Sphingomonas sp. BT552]